MSETDYDAYLGLLARFLRLDSRQREEIGRELRAHIEEAVDADMARGIPREQAIRRALDEFGDAAELAARFSSIGRKRRWIMRGTLTAACIGFAALALNVFTGQSTPPVVASSGDLGFVGGQRATRTTAARVDDPIAKALRQEIPEVAFEEVSFKSLVEYVRDIVKVNIHVRWRRLEDSGIDADTPVTIKLKGVSAGQLLDLVLEDVGVAEPLGHEVRDGVLIISTREALTRRRTTRTYDVRDLLGWVVAATGRQMFPAVALVNDPANPLGGATASGTEMASAAYAGKSAEELTQLILNAVEPDSWRDAGGSGYLQLFNGILVVRQYDSAHRELDALLSDLRQAGAGEQ